MFFGSTVENIESNTDVQNLASLHGEQFMLHRFVRKETKIFF